MSRRLPVLIAVPVAIAVAATGAYACYPRAEDKSITLTGAGVADGQQGQAARAWSSSAAHRTSSTDPAGTSASKAPSRVTPTRKNGHRQRPTFTRGSHSPGQFPTRPGGTFTPGTPTTAPTTAAPTTAPSTTTSTSTTSTSATVPSTTKPSTTKPSTTKPSTTTTGSSSAGTFIDQVVKLTNQQRTSNGCQALTVNTTLTAVAQAHSEDMAKRNFFDHSNPDGKSPFDRMTAAGYQYRAAAENIAAGYATADAVVTGWMNSEGHRKNILNCGLTEIGVGYATGGSYGTYWTQDFGTPR